MEVFTYKDVAKILKVCERTVWAIVNSGELKASRVSGTVRITKEDLQEYLRNSQIKH